VLRLLTTDDFAQWFAGLGDPAAEDVATALEIVAQLGPEKAAPGSRTSLLWYEHPSISHVPGPSWIVGELEDWGDFRDYAHQILQAIESPRFTARLMRLAPSEAARVFESIERLKRMADPRTRWTFKVHAAGTASETAAAGTDERQQGARAELRRIYLDVLAAAGFELIDLPAHSLALRELSRRLPAPGFRLLYGVDAERERALFVLGERLDKSYYGDSVRRAERLWQRFQQGTLRANERAAPR
jgi:hypothetical protein